ncbi:MerR family transcriptional regulator [Ktedonosporobacter rubrisoli]|uniref:MerR family transcriptional regulator n=1 Tax=Ktedonosporobacter rubrisoli TaxID=2509675 RepID=A0A4P6JTL3_KTERU|nr:MerR family transcriptional regulator [Ktedonosporobacter rubrisoli]QBD78640.1 MerR family transcriptional regulator [Ktedonosporobacter rubrisoli]
MKDDEQHWTIEELAEEVNIPIRTIRYYISEGLLPGPYARGKAATYDEVHLFRLRLIRLLSQQRMPLAQMRSLLANLTLPELQTLLAEEEQRAAELQHDVQQPPPKEYIAKLLQNARTARQTYAQHSPIRQLREAPQPAPTAERWQRWQLAPGIELHIRSDAEDQQRGLLERIFHAAGMIYKSTRDHNV